MTTRIQRGGNAMLYTVLTLGIVVFVNLIAARIFARIDLTEDNIYTLSEASKRLVAGIPDRMTVKAFISQDLPPHPQIKAIERYLRDLLDEYATHSAGKLVWEAISPDDEEAKKEAQRLKVPPRNLAVYGQTSSSVAQAYLGVAFQYGGKVESIPFVGRMDDLEYQISSTIRRLTTPKKKVGISSGHGEPSTFRGLAGVNQALKDYEVTTVDLAEGKKPVPDEVDVLLVIAPQKPFSERAKYELDRFLIKGKALALFLDGTKLETPRGQFQGQTPPRIARAHDVGLGALLEHYGVKLGQDIVMDRQNQRVQVPAGQGQLVITNYPAFPKVTTLDKEHPITRKLRGFIGVFPSSLALTKAAQEGKAGVSATVLARSSDASWKQTGFFLFDPLRQPKPTEELGPFPLAVALKGSFNSFFAGKPVPAAPGATSQPTRGDSRKSPPTARLVVFGDGDMVQDQFLGLSQGANLALLLNTVDFLAQDETLIGIRTKSQTRRPLEKAEDSTVLLAKLGNIVGVPLAFIILGIVRWRLHRAQRRRRAKELCGKEREPSRETTPD